MGYRARESSVYIRVWSCDAGQVDSEHPFINWKRETPTSPTRFPGRATNLSKVLWTYKQLDKCSVTKSCLTLCNPMDCSMPGFLGLHYLQEFTQTYVELVMPSNHLILCCPLFLLPSIFPSIRVFSNELTLPIRWPVVGASASASILSMNIQGWFPLGLTGLIFFRIHWFDLLAAQGTLKSLLQHYNLKESIL